MNEKNNRNFIIAVVILSALFTISAGFNIGLGRSIQDNQRLRNQQRGLEATIARLETEQRADREIIRELRSLNREASGIVRGIINTVEANGASLSAANKILRQVIVALQRLDLLYGRDRGSGSDGLDTLGSE
jgi:chromosome condensin MukBEF complex kleisin-like MukF subunit